MGACAGRNKQNESKSNGKHQHPDLPFDGRNNTEERTFHGEKLWHKQVLGGSIEFYVLHD